MDFLEAKVIIDGNEFMLNEYTSFNNLCDSVNDELGYLPDDWELLEYENLHENFIGIEGIMDAYWDIVDSTDLYESQLPMLYDFMDNDASYYSGSNLDNLLNDFINVIKYDSFSDLKASIMEDLSLPYNVANAFDFDKYWQEQLSHEYWESPNGYVFSNQ